MKIALLFIIFLLLSCSKEKSSQNQDSINEDVRLKDICVLQENINLFSEISSFVPINDSIFAIASVNPAQILLYNLLGKQILKIGKFGNGPYEYISPSIVKYHNNRIYIWCSSNLRLLVFDINGKPLLEFTNFNKAIKNFQIIKNLLVTYSAGGFNDPIVQLYDLDKKKYIKEGFGNQSNEHKILNAFQCSGALTSDENTILFSAIDRPIINKINTDDFKLQKFSISDPKFKVKKVQVDHVQFMTDIYQSTQYIFSSDIITGLYNTTKNYIITGETGEVKMDGLNFKDISERRQLFYILDKNCKILYSIRSNIPKGNNPCLYAAYDEDLYNITYHQNDSSFHLNKIIFPK